MSRKTQRVRGSPGTPEAAGGQPGEGGELFELLAKEVADWAVFELDAEGRVTSWNFGAERLMGFGSHEITGESFSRVLIPEDLEAGKPVEQLQQAAALGRCETECWALRKDGSVFWAQVVCLALRDQTEALRGFALVMQDLMRSKAAETALQLCLEVLDRFSEGLLVLCSHYHASGRSLTVGAANTAVVQLIWGGGLSVEELSGAKWSDISEAFRSFLKEDITSSLWAVIDSGEARELGQIHCGGPGLGEVDLALKAFPLPHCCVGLLFEKKPP